MIKYNLNTYLFGNITEEIRRRDFDKGSWGSIAPYWCEDCGPRWDEGEEVCTYRQTWETPAEYENYCPNCGKCDYGDNEDPRLGFKVVKRQKIYGIRPIKSNHGAGSR